MASNLRYKLSISIFVFANIFLGLPNKIQSVLACEGYATVVWSFDSKYPFLKNICRGEDVRPSSTIYVSCRLTHAFGKINRPQDMAPCEPEKPLIDPCPDDNDKSCFRGRKGESKPIPAIKTPIGSVFLFSQKTISLSWQTVPKASSYEIVIWDDLRIYRYFQNTNQYDIDSSKIKTGKIYQLMVTALDDNHKKISSSVSSVKILSRNDSLEVRKYINNASKLSDRLQKINAITSIYNYFGLIDESQSYLQNLSSTDKNNPSILELVGNNYMIAGKLEQAKNILLKADTLSKITDNKVAQREIENSLVKIRNLIVAVNN